jgi:hypothetical protein
MEEACRMKKGGRCAKEGEKVEGMLTETGKGGGRLMQGVKDVCCRKGESGIRKWEGKQGRVKESKEGGKKGHLFLGH